MNQIQEMTALISKAEIAMKAATWEIERLRDDVAMLRKALTELAYVAEENGVYLLCAEEGGFHGMTLEETTRCASMLRVIRAEQKMTSFQRQLQKDMES